MPGFLDQTLLRIGCAPLPITCIASSLPETGLNSFFLPVMTSPATAASYASDDWVNEGQAAALVIEVIIGKTMIWLCRRMRLAQDVASVDSRFCAWMKENMGKLCRDPCENYRH